ncbi:bactofilin family protein [Rhodoluna limnophila]|uniref:bactofilin family protein n=1 Tax=Rhodoluna limnophila TaxID=232537 RepID=UPI001561B49C|nr:polymer-forming cytoskeletal protein [Rhodoluna limnophila]
MTTQSRVDGDVISSGAGVTLSNSTVRVGGSLYANGTATIHGAVIGRIEATGAVTIVQGSSVGSTIAAGSTVSVASTVGGSITTPGNLNFVDTGRVTGNINIGGTLSFGRLRNAAAASELLAQGLVTGTISFESAGIVAPTPKPAPEVPDWIDFEYDFADWQATGFQTELDWPANLGCRLGDSSSTTPSGVLYPFYQQLKNLSAPTVVDARGCATVAGDVELALKTDVAFIGNDFNFDVVNISSADGATHRMWFVIPDAQPTVEGPQCVRRAGDFQVNTPSVIADHVVAMVYASCSIAINNGTQWQGQLYSGDMSGGGGTRVLEYIPIGVPGTNIGGGPIYPATYKLGALVSQRNRSDSGE